MHFAASRHAPRRLFNYGGRASEVIDRLRSLVMQHTPRRDSIDLNEAILEVIAQTRDEARVNEISLTSSLAGDLPRVEDDRVQLQQVILNLIVNAIGAMGAVSGQPRELRIASAQDDAGGGRVEVRDSGPGIESSQAERLFEAFYTTKAKGIGIGLSISRSIIEAHGGRLWAGPNARHGAVFQFSLPVDKASSYLAYAGGS